MSQSFVQINGANSMQSEINTISEHSYIGTFFVVDSISDSTIGPSHKLKFETLPSYIRLADPTIGHDQINLLLGVEPFFKIVQTNTITIDEKSPQLHETDHMFQMRQTKLFCEGLSYE